MAPFEPAPRLALGASDGIYGLDFYWLFSLNRRSWLAVNDFGAIQASTALGAWRLVPLTAFTPTTLIGPFIRTVDPDWVIFFWRLLTSTLIGSLYGVGSDWLFLFLIQSVLDAQWLAYQVQMYYASESDRREEILKTFNIFPDKFDHMTVVRELNSEIESGVTIGTLNEKK